MRLRVGILRFRHFPLLFWLLVSLGSQQVCGETIGSNEPLQIGRLPVSYTGLPDDFLYPAYLADPLAVNSQISIRNYQIDEIHPRDDGTEQHFDITIGMRYNFFRFSPIGSPDLGIEMDWGMALTTFMDTDRTDLLGVDGIYYFSLAVRPSDWAAFRLTRHHICSHMGDQLDSNGDGSSLVDFDMGLPLNEGAFVRDDYVISAMVEPLFGLEPILPVIARSLRVYGDYSFYLPGDDPILLGWRNLAPSDHSFIWYQYGAEVELPIANGNSGSLFAAGQISRWQETGYAPNISLQVGYIFARGKKGQRFKIAYQHYDGQSLLNNFRYRRAKFSGFLFTFDK
ncbi:MAG: DUF1207 domain-containing protein [Spirochaetia bacterium]|nr:DUF1207 domain-containing protein [Spirochaetia bacterium]